MIRVLGTAGFWRRGAALGVDAMWLFCAGGALTWLLFGTALPFGPATSVTAMAAQAVHKLLPAAVFIVGWARWGCTPGKLLLELRVVDARTGERPGWVQSGIRYIGYLVSALPLGLGFLWAAFDRNGAALHDKLAGTRVVRIDERVLPLQGAGP